MKFFEKVRAMHIKTFDDAIFYCTHSHQHFPKKPEKAFRKWDGVTPYAVHPIWCAATILKETTLDEQTRQNGSFALLFHDILEDTTAPLPEDMPTEVFVLLLEMNFESFEEEVAALTKMRPIVRLLKLYDKVSNLLDGVWMSDEKKNHYRAYTARLLSHVRATYGELNIVRIASTLI